MRSRTAIAVVCASQYVATGLGVVWGLALAHRTPGLPFPRLPTGATAAALLGVETLRFLTAPLRRVTQPLVPWLCGWLAAYAGWLMSVETFMWYRDDDGSGFIIGILLLLPFLVALGPLVRARA